MKILIAFDKFKDSLTAHEACAIVAEVLQPAVDTATLVQAPMADGGEGFCEILTRAYSGRLEWVSVLGPRFEPVQAKLGWVGLERLPLALREQLGWPAQGNAAIIEMAQASGLELLAPVQRDCWQTSTYGTGQLIKHAISANAAAILLGIGGSATCDLGIGALEALGFQFVGNDQTQLNHLAPKDFKRICAIKSGLEQALPVTCIACDVRNPLLGTHGTAAVYGPQKGLPLHDIHTMDSTLASVATLLMQHCNAPADRLEEPGSGAAGGIGFGLRVVAPTVEYVPGFELVWQWLQLEQHLAEADIVITGEGRFDASSLQGKGPGTLVREAVRQGKRVFVLAGKVDSALDIPRGVSTLAITPEGTPLAEALSQAPQYLRRAAHELVSQI
ncbi:MAG: glycerate kinase [Verrucomicrobiota bacterium]|nr:glycerate kinase [Verrucomicrobiota bacterium]